MFVVVVVLLFCLFVLQDMEGSSIFDANDYGFLSESVRAYS